MKTKLRLFFAPNEQQYYIYYFRGAGFVLYRVENINPLNILLAESFGMINTNDRQLIKEIEEFARSEFEKLNFGF